MSVKILLKYGMDAIENNKYVVKSTKPENWVDEWQIYGGISIDVDGKIIPGLHQNDDLKFNSYKKDEPIFSGDYLLYNINCFLSSVKFLIKGQTAVCECLDDTPRFVFQPDLTKHIVEIRYETNPSAPQTQFIISANAKINEFIEETIRISTEFLNDIKKSPHLRKNKKVKELKKNLEDTKDNYKKFKNKSN